MRKVAQMFLLERLEERDLLTATLLLQTMASASVVERLRVHAVWLTAVNRGLSALPARQAFRCCFKVAPKSTAA